MAKQKMHFEIVINAPKEKVWHTMLDDMTYREWTKAFSPGGYFEGDWSKGSKMIFLGPDPETAEVAGMVSRIADNKPYEFLSIEHQGIVKNGIEDTTSDEAKKWALAFENYTFTEKEGNTIVQVDMEMAESEVDIFKGMWPPALQRLKELSEA